MAREIDLQPILNSFLEKIPKLITRMNMNMQIEQSAHESIGINAENEATAK